jgi:peptidoglycan/xylan/chitin deacetylase (PgdA/CDA1 family)
VIGSKLADSSAAALMREAYAAGHWIGNHTLTHTIALGDRPDPAYVESEIGGAQARIGKLSHPEKLFRPYGNDGLIGPHLLSRAAVSYLLEHDYSCVLWNNVPGDWRGPDGWVEACLAAAAGQEWSVIVLHDIPDACAARLQEMTARFNDLGVQWEQAFPESVILTRRGEIVSLVPSYVSDNVPAGNAVSRGAPSRPG